MNRVFRSALTPILFSVLAIVFLAVPVIALVGSQLILVPKRRALEERHHLVLKHPEDYGIRLEAFLAGTAEGYGLRGFLVEPSSEPERGERTGRMLARLERNGVPRSATLRGTVILLHGRGGLKENMLTVAQRFVAADFRCVVYDARAHGESGGRFCTFGATEKADLSAVLDQVERRLRERGESLGPVLAFGNSLGAAVTLLALPEESRISGAVVVAPYASFREQVSRSIGLMTRGLFPRPLREIMIRSACFRGRFDANAVAPEVSVKRVAAPVLLIHGGLDQVIPVEDSRRLLRALPGENRRLIEVPHGHHYNVLAEGGDDLYEEMIHFYLGCLSRG